MSSRWYQNAIVYTLDVRTFFDANGDGFGDLAGLSAKLDYLAALGVTCLWLLPFHPSPLRDGGYDVSDHYGVDPRVGSFGDLVRFLEEASDRGIAVLGDLVVNHTSSDHPWFREARSSRRSPHHPYYVWSEEIPADSPDQIVFGDGDENHAPWSWNEATSEHYLHRFYEHEPDLDHSHPAVTDETVKILGFWLRLGFSGFRIDAAPYLAEKGGNGERFDGPHDYLRFLRTALSERRPDAIFMAEADVERDRLGDYFGRGDQVNLLLDFLMASTTFLALARGRAGPLVDTLDKLPRPPATAHYANFLRNHDELDLERLSPGEQEEVYAAFAPEQSMRVYGRGIRRRLASMLEGDTRRIRLARSLLFSLPGTPILRYGDEIGMGDDLSLPERTAVRTPMQWSSEPNAGFSTAPAEDLYLPVVTTGAFGSHRVNVADQWPDPDSSLNWTARLVAARKQSRAVGMGAWRVLDVGDDRVLGLRFDHEGEVTVTLHNLGRESVQAWLPEMDDLSFLHGVFGDRRYEEVGSERRDVRLEGSGYCWLAGRTAVMPGANAAAP